MIDWDGLGLVPKTVLGGNVEIEGDWGFGRVREDGGSRPKETPHVVRWGID